MARARIEDVFFAIVAAVLAGSLAATCWHDVSQGYDVWYYHLPFAARLVGLTSPATYALSAENLARYQGFPLLAELLQGLVWRATGHVTATSLVALGGLVGLAAFVRRAFRAPAAIAFLALLGIPLVQIHATAGYIDLPANACATMLLLVVLRALVRGRIGARGLVVAALLAASTANMKFQLVPVVLVAAVVLLFLALRDRAGRGTRLAILAIAFPLVFATPLKNAAIHGNPVWPVALHVSGRDLPHVEEAYAQSPPGLRDAPRFVRFVHSVLEIDNPPIGQHRWSLDQWAPAEDPACRMGGYFGAYVLVNLVALGIAVARRTRLALAAGGLFAVVTVAAALVPQSHELRYYLHWMMLLVCLNVILWSRERLPRLATGLVGLAALGIVAWSTDGGYLYPSGTTFDRYVATRAEASVVEGAAKGERLCIARQPFTFLYAPLFHPGHDYAVQERAEESDCQGARFVP